MVFWGGAMVRFCLVRGGIRVQVQVDLDAYILYNSHHPFCGIIHSHRFYEFWLWISDLRIGNNFVLALNVALTS